MKGRILLMLGWLLTAICLAPDATAQNKGSEFGNHFMFHQSRYTSYYIVDDTLLSSGTSSLVNIVIL
jgi:hypothetical protein